MDEGYTYVADLDLSKFFDRVNHDRLINRLAGKIKDKRVLSFVFKKREKNLRFFKSNVERELLRDGAQGLLKKVKPSSKKDGCASVYRTSF
jgi:retron-type reverse transcriptase